MKTGMNLLLWTDHVTERHDPIQALGFDAVESRSEGFFHAKGAS